jgi:cell wall-associated NlpC family hydrolase
MQHSQETPRCIVRSSPDPVAHPPMGNLTRLSVPSTPARPSHSAIACVICMLAASVLIGMVMLRLGATPANPDVEYAVRSTAMASSTLVYSDAVLGEVELVLGQPYNEPAVQTGAPTVYLNLRSGPSTQYAVLTTLAPSTSLTLYEQQDGWYRVSTANGFTGYAASWYIQTTGEAPIAALAPTSNAAVVSGSTAGTFVSGSIANIRSGPGTDHQLYGSLPYGTQLYPQAQYNGWYLVSAPNAMVGWIAGWLVSINPQLAASLPVAEAPHSDDISTAQPMHAGEHAHHAVVGSADAAQVALRYVGLPYRWGATGPHAFDCSGLVQHVYAQLGVELPRTTSQQFSGQHGQIISSMDALQAGDIIFLANTYAAGITHNGVYLGNGEVLHAATSELGVQIDSISNPYWTKHWVGAIRPHRSTH